MRVGSPLSPGLARYAWRAALVALLGVLAAPRLAAQPEALSFRHLNVDQGLSAGKVNAVLQDRRGFVWAGTLDGLNRFDGYAVTEFRHAEDDAASLSDNTVWCLLEDRDGYLWVGTTDGGLNRFDPATETFAAFRHDPEDPASLPADEVFALAQDAEGHLWVGTSEGLSRLDPETGGFTTYRAEQGRPGGLRHSLVQALFVDRDGTLWVGTQDGLHRYDAGTDTFEAFRTPDDPAGNIISVLAGRSQGGLWVGTYGGGLRRFDPTAGAFAPIPLEDNRLTSVIASLWEDRQGTLWVGTAGRGLYRLAAGRAPIVYRAERGNPESLSDNFVRAVMEDRQGVVWAGTYNGLDWCDPSHSAFLTYSHDPDRPESLRSSTIESVLQGRDGTLWIGTDEGLHRADGPRRAFTVFTPPNPFATALHENADGSLWVGTQGGLYRFSGGRFRLVGPDLRIVSALHEDRQGRLWVGMLDAGLMRVARDGDLSTFAHEPGRAASLGHDYVKAFAETPDGTLWVGTRSGLDRLDDEAGGGRFTHFRHDPADEESLSDDAVLALYARTDGTLWIGTEDGGLNRFDPRRPGEGFTRYTEANTELPSNTVHAILEDDTGFLWLSTSRGLARFDPVTETFRAFADEQGPGARSLNSAAAKGASGELFFGSADGLLAFRPAQLSAVNPHPPQVALTSVQILGEAVRPGPDTPLPAAAPVAEAIYLDHDDYVVTFEFAALHFADPTRNRYAVQLDGFDRDWRELGTDRRATYTGLDPGTYTLRVRAVSADGVASETPLAVRVVVDPPWWRSVWAYLFYALLFVGVLIGVDRLQRQRLLRRERERAERREAELRAEMAEAETRVLKVENDRKAMELEKARELERAYEALEKSHRDLKATQAQLIQAEKLASLGQLTAGIAHEIKNPLNFVNNFADLSVELADELHDELTADAERPVSEVLPALEAIIGDLKENARRIHEHGQRADRIVYAMLQHSRGGAGEPMETDVNAFVEEYANLAYHGMRAKDAEFNATLEYDLDPSAGAIAVVPQELGRVLINLLGNAFDAVRAKARTADADYSPTVRLATQRTPEAVHIHIADNGPGIPPDLRQRIFEPFFTTKATGEGTGLGLSLSYEIVTQGHGGDLRLETGPDGGAAFKIELPVA